MRAFCRPFVSRISPALATQSSTSTSRAPVPDLGGTTYEGGVLPGNLVKGWSSCRRRPQIQRTTAPFCLQRLASSRTCSISILVPATSSSPLPSPSLSLLSRSVRTCASSLLRSPCAPRLRLPRTAPTPSVSASATACSHSGARRPVQRLATQPTVFQRVEVLLRVVLIEISVTSLVVYTHTFLHILRSGISPPNALLPYRSGITCTHPSPRRRS
ncbi:hypothetical protein C8R45DRAFT_413163 [Mycena sanguinolenta]|nr:hypothetical protein C8R45DRAFT_413163 [Mycena sanguinolenta]